MKHEDLVLNAMRLAERAHRSEGQFRKAPEGEDRPAYFLHLAEVAWMLQEANLPEEVVAAGFLHDMIEDCGYTRESLRAAIDNERVAELVDWVCELAKEGHTWEQRNAAYLDRMKTADPEVLSLSCADKTSNLRDMCRLLDKEYQLHDFLNRGADQQISKFEGLDEVFRGQVLEVLYQRFSNAFSRLKAAV